MTGAGLCYNSKNGTVTIESRLFTSLTRFRGQRFARESFTFPACATVHDVSEAWGLPKREVFLCLRNGRNVTPGLVGTKINGYVVLNDGDVIALSGPVPYSCGYGAPIV